jgi:AmmeMemoRadiSam system protein B/AmmeMemoRadiSam system protein A
MKTGKWLARTLAGCVAIGLTWGSALCQSRPAAPSPGTQPAARAEALPPIREVREPAVAGLFYPKDANVLAATIDRLLAEANQPPVENLRALICPHAGYEFSGQTAACSYKQLAGRDVKTVIVLAPSHYAYFDGAFLPTADAYRTPLGLVRISPKAAELAKTPPFTTTMRGRVDRPDWTAKSPKAAPPVGGDTPDTWEHAVEVQVPFLQRVLKDSSFSMVSVVYGQVDSDAVAKALAPVLDDQTVIVASSDLSHYHPYDDARKLDDRCVGAALTLDLERMAGQEACGKGPILTLLRIAVNKGWRARFLDYRNSGDVTGDKRGVVGYAAIAFYEPGKAGSTFTAAQRKQLLELARKALRESAGRQGDSTAASAGKGALAEALLHVTAEAEALTGKLAEARGTFVTLTKGGQLRGCIGNILPAGSLAKSIVGNTQNAALHDSRFNPVQADEVDKIEIEVSVLSLPEPLYFKDWQDLIFLLRRGQDGVILRIGDHTATFLPQVWEEIPDKGKFLSALSVKAGCKPDAWKTEATSVFTYHVEAFRESDK